MTLSFLSNSKMTMFYLYVCLWFGPAIIDGVFGTGSSFPVVWRTAGRIKFLFFQEFLASAGKIFISGFGR